MPDPAQPRLPTPVTVDANDLLDLARAAKRGLPPPCRPPAVAALEAAAREALERNLVGKRVRIVSYCGQTDPEAMSCAMERGNARRAIGHVGVAVFEAAQGDLFRVEPSAHPDCETWAWREELVAEAAGAAEPAAAQ